MPYLRRTLRINAALRFDAISLAYIRVFCAPVEKPSWISLLYRVFVGEQPLGLADKRTPPIDEHVKVRKQRLLLRCRQIVRWIGRALHGNLELSPERRSAVHGRISVDLVLDRVPSVCDRPHEQRN